MSRSDTFLEKMVNGPRIIIVTGHFGSGKTEFSVSLAYALGELRRAGDERLKEHLLRRICSRTVLIHNIEHPVIL